MKTGLLGAAASLPRPQKRELMSPVNMAVTAVGFLWLACAAVAQSADRIIPADMARSISVDQTQDGDYLHTGAIYSSRDDLEKYQGTTTETGGVFAGSGVIVYYIGCLAAAMGDGYQTATQLGTLTDGTTASGPHAMSGTQVHWFKFTLPANVTDALNTFLDLDAEGSTGDFSIALYAGNSQAAIFGNVIASDTDSGSGVNPMLSFGMGRRAAVGNGRQYDGRNNDGSRGLSAGTYYLAIAPNGSSFDNGFQVNPGTLPAPAQAQLTLRTNVNARALAPSVVPLIAPADAFDGPLTAPGVRFAAQPMAGDTPRWLRIDLCHGASDAEPITLDWEGTNTIDGASATFFTDSGNLQNQTVWSGTGTPPPVTFNDANPLPSGRFYIALSYATVHTQPVNPTMNGRWHLRGAGSPAVSTFAGGITVTNASCCTTPGPCGGADYNGDGDTGTDADIEAFFACLGGNCCATCFCGGSDFNGDGDYGTDADIEAFFRVLAGSC